MQDYCNNYLPKTFLLFVSGVASGMASYNFLHKAASEIPDTFGDNGQYSKANLIMEVTRGMPNNPTTHDGPGPLGNRAGDPRRSGSES